MGAPQNVSQLCVPVQTAQARPFTSIALIITPWWSMICDSDSQQRVMVWKEPGLLTWHIVDVGITGCTCIQAVAARAHPLQVLTRQSVIKGPCPGRAELLPPVMTAIDRACA